MLPARSSPPGPCGGRGRSRRRARSRWRTGRAQLELALLPLAKAGLLGGPVEIVGITGSSGSGIAPSAGTHHPTRVNNLKTYKPLEHQHIPEGRADARRGGRQGILTLRFVPVSAPLSARHLRDLLRARRREGGRRRGEEALRRDRSRASPSCACRRSVCPRSLAVKGTNYCEVGVQPGDVADGKRAVACFAVTDNLVKGGAGEAIQSMNIMLGLDERLTLQDPGGWPSSEACAVVITRGGVFVASSDKAAIAADAAELRRRGDRARHRARRRSASDRPPEEARPDPARRGRPAHHRRRRARSDEDDRRRQGQRRRVLRPPRRRRLLP